MAIKFVDIEPEGGKPTRAKTADAPPAAREPDAERPGVSPLPYAKPAQQRRVRK